ncbi:stage II sporulation protein P [Alkaliphilus peptidifermentans]|uniref:Stage II sporulation protein P n=1 Tax=Alkaliphilus peptidifermentans DSM 18978 TaxID=1120976 RepID=A0A1G5BY82_9FIRM|nr:stage II sporulation protein P [Alkaliphilus peptidifermentans]SCX94960.1 stage II sporulation protein P [Alkaliphilus peptidifermentans DSM 18978]
MLIKKINFLKDFRNIIILVLAFSILVIVYNIISNNNAYATGEKDTGGVSQFLVGYSNGGTSQLLHQAINHVFPGSGGRTGWQFSQLQSIFKNLHSRLFFVDLKNPLTFIESQFPAIALIDKSSGGFFYAGAKNLPDSEKGNDIDFEEVDRNGLTEEAMANNPSWEDPDDMGESRSGIYLPDSNEIIDSLDIDLRLSLDTSEMPRSIKLEKGKPQILIYHTHGTESYRPASEGNYHTLRKEYSVITIGEIMKEELEKRGFEVIHDTTYHDYPSYNGSYGRSLSTAEAILKKYPSIKVVFDVHRDGYDHIETNPNRENIIKNNQVDINGETVSKFQLVIGSETPNRGEVTKFAQLIKAVSDTKYPEFSKPVLVKPYGRFNQFLTDHYALLEVGSNANSIEEAKEAAVYLTEILADTLNHLKE